MTRKTTNKYSLITIVNYELYQFEEAKATSNLTNERQTNDKQMTTNKEYKNNKNIYCSSTKEYENEIGTLTGVIMQELISYQDELSEEMIIEAIHIASRNNKRSWSYIKAILNRWVRNGYKTITEVKNEKKVVKVNFVDKEEKNYNELYEN